MALPSLPTQARRLLELAQEDRAAARDAFAALPDDAQVELVCTSPAARRGELLDLARAPEKLIPRLPEAELCFTVKGIGLEAAGWVLEHATSEQIVAALDLDGWDGDRPDGAALDGWLAALTQAGDATLLRSVRALDPEVVVLELRRRLQVWLKPAGDEDWVPPEQTRTLEGQFFWRARHESDDVAALDRLLRVLIAEDYWLYFRLMQGAIWELDSETEVWARRWRVGRLEDLGFPERSEATLALYSHLPPEEIARVPEEARALDTEAWRLPVWQPRLPVAPDARHAVFRAAARLPGEDRAAFFYALLGLANAVAVADQLPLGDAESLPRTIERAAERASDGLEHLASVTGLGAEELLRRVPLIRLFRVGVNLRGEKPPMDDLEGPGGDSGLA